MYRDGESKLFRPTAATMMGDLQRMTLSSASTLDSQELLEHALRDLVNESGRRNGWCRGEPITDDGKRRQMTKMMLLLLAPAALLFGIGGYYMVENVGLRDNNLYTRSVMEFSIELGEFIHVLQRERDQSVLYLSDIGPTTKTFLLQRYLETDTLLDQLSDWPVVLQASVDQYFLTKSSFQRHLVSHRNALDLLGLSIFEELEFYNRPIAVFQKWVYDAITETRYSTMWKSLISYQKILTAKSHAGVERALGANCLSRGGFTDLENYLWYNQEVNIFRFLYRVARKFSDMVYRITNIDTESVDGARLAAIIATYRNRIQFDNITVASLDEAAHFFDNMTNYIDILLVMQGDVADNIIIAVDITESGTVSTLILTAVVLLFVLGLIPILIRAVYKTTSDIQSYALTLADKTKQLNREKRKTDSLLHQMLPKQVAKKLKQGEGVSAEYFKEVSVFFSDVVGFTMMTKMCSPMQIVAMLNELYNLFDGRIDLYDVYKVETIKDSYMVASGLPQRNGTRHASEIARLALDLLMSCASVDMEYVPGGKVRLRIGIHTGPVMAGIVGCSLPRYCLFGDTVNTASRMETTGQPDRIHISRMTYKYLLRNGGFKMALRGTLDVKGKGTTTTYWLQSIDDSIRPRKNSRDDAPDTPVNRSSAENNMSTVDLGREEVKIIPHTRNPTVSWAQPKPIHVPVLQTCKEGPKPSTSTAVQLFDDDTEDFPPPSYRDVERQFREKQGSPPILQLQEGFHF